MAVGIKGEWPCFFHTLRKSLHRVRGSAQMGQKTLTSAATVADTYGGEKEIVARSDSLQSGCPLMQQVNLGIIGGGTVGGGVFQAIQRNGALMSSRLGVGLRIIRMAVRDVHKPRAVPIPPSLLTTDWASVVSDPEINLIVELMGGTTTAP